jgi:N,N'-diacetyllegionaminate synthase
MPSTFVIAEAGVNHNGSLELAKKLVDVAVEAGANAVKFQTFQAKKLLTRAASKAGYQEKTTSVRQSQYEMIRLLELSEEAHKELIAYCLEKNIMFMSTPFDNDSVDMLAGFGMQIFKIPSGEITNLPYLRHVGKQGKQVIMSTGISNLGEIEDALNVLLSCGLAKSKITILHATTEYPCPMEDVNLRAMQTIRNAFHIGVGYSDHSQGIEVAVAAVALGAEVIEKHFTLDRSMEGPDHLASLEPDELISMIRSIRNIDLALGDGIKKASVSEESNRIVARKSIVAATAIFKGDKFTVDNITVKRPGSGISPMRWDEIVGQTAQKNYASDDLI